ncbi:DUF4336 domain-containing protein [Pendulispora albinea]|uniref:DUF4336 domain-containing protein n=1 Tax=Pendulispora albinea TaxID=2741071 RepID=A0ABZ2LM46_9BACT
MLHMITDVLWTLEDTIRLGGGMQMPARATIVRLSKGGQSGESKLVLHSPLAIDDETARGIARLGKVEWIVAPNCMHHLFLKGACERWPNARVLGAPGLERKLGEGVRFEALPSEGPLFDGEMAVRRIDGAPSLAEHVFFHPGSRTLVVSDLVFNVHAAPGFSLPLFLRIVSAWKKLAQSRVWRLLVKDRAAAAQSAEDVLRWDFDRLVMAHGDVVEANAREELATALTWMRHLPSPPLSARTTG